MTGAFRLFAAIFLFPCLTEAQQLVFPDSAAWATWPEGKALQYQVHVTDASTPKFSIEGANGYGISFDSLGRFFWQPSFDLVDRITGQKEINLIFQAEWKDGRKIRKAKTIVLQHTNRPPAVDDLPVFYVRQGNNTYTALPDYVRDPDGDPIVFKAIPSQMPEGVTLSSGGLVTWLLSRNQFAALKNNAAIIEFIVQDQPGKEETRGRIRVAQTQLDLPPDLLMVPADSVFSLREDERVNLKIYVSDPNGDDNIAGVDFVSSDARIIKNVWKENSPVQYEFTWMPGYEFVNEADRQKRVEIIFFAFDKSANRVQRKVTLNVLDAENLEEKDKLLFQRYRLSLVQAKTLIDQLDENHEKLTKMYKQAKKGKKNRAIVNASLGATTGLSPLLLEIDQSRAVSALGGTAVLTMGTLEATEVIGKSKSDILDRMKVNVEIRNQLQVEGDNFARKYALKSARRSKEFAADREKLVPLLNHQKLVLLELDASRPAIAKVSDEALRKTFPDFGEE